MEISFLLFKQILSQFLMLAVGFILIRMKVLKSDDATAVSKLVLYVITPCSIFASFDIGYSGNAAANLIFGFVGGLCGNLLCITVGALVRKVLKLDAVEEMSIAFPNSGNMILPLVLATFGGEWGVYVSCHVIVQNFLIFSYCESKIRGETKFNPLKLFIKPCIIACTLAIVFYLLHIELPDILNNTIAAFGNMIAPASMLVIGMAMGGADFKAIFTTPKNYLISLLRLTLIPLVAILLIKITGVAYLLPDARMICLILVMCASSCPAATVTNMAQCYANQPGKCSAINMMSICFLIVTMPLAVWLYQTII